MAMTFIRIHGIGNLTRNPELRYAPSGTPILNFGLACTYVYNSGGEKKEDKCFVDCVSFGKTAEAASQYITKGSKIYVEGRLSYRTWEAEGGGKRSKHEIVAEKIVFLDTKQNQGGYQQGGGESGYYEDGPEMQ